MKLVSNNTACDIYLHTASVNIHNARLIVSRLRSTGIWAYTELLGSAREVMAGEANVNVLVRHAQV